MLFQRELCRVVCKIPNLNLKISPHNLKVVGSIPAPATNRLSASHPTGFFCAVKVLVTKGFAKTDFSIRPFQSDKIASKTSLFLCFSLKQRDMSFREWVCITHWTTPSNKILPEDGFLSWLHPVNRFFGKAIQFVQLLCNFLAETGSWFSKIIWDTLKLTTWSLLNTTPSDSRRCLWAVMPPNAYDRESCPWQLCTYSISGSNSYPQCLYYCLWFSCIFPLLRRLLSPILYRG